jgi:DNA-binding response OmpR family regulator
MADDQRLRQPESFAAGVSARTELRVAVVDRDAGFVEALAGRLATQGVRLRVFSGSPSPGHLVALRVSALVVDPGALGPAGWADIARMCVRLRTLSVIVCTRRSSVAERVRGLRLGVDAWLTKPCHVEEVIATIEAVTLRHRGQALPELEQAMTVGELTVRPDDHQAYVGELSAELTPREFDILNLFSRADRVLRREEIYERVWGYAMARGDRSVDVFVRRVRQKLRAVSPGWEYIHTHFGVGYRFAAELRCDPASSAGADIGSRAAVSALLA